MRKNIFITLVVFSICTFINAQFASAQEKIKIKPEIVFEGDPTGLAVNPETNTIYVITNEPNFTSIDGSNTGSTTVNRSLLVDTPLSETQVAMTKITDIAIDTDNNIIILLAENIDENINALFLVNGNIDDIETEKKRTQTEPIEIEPIKIRETQFLDFIPGDLAVNTNKNEIYISNPFNNEISVFNANSAEFVNTINVGTGTTIKKIAYNQKTKFLYAFDSKKNEIIVIDTAGNNKIVEGSPIEDIDDSFIELKFNTVTERVYMAFSDGFIKVLYGTSTLRFIKEDKNSNNDFGRDLEIEIKELGGDISGIAVNPSTNHIFAISESDDKVFVIDGNTNQISKNIEVKDPIAIEINPRTNDVYVINNNNENIAIIKYEVTPTPAPTSTPGPVVTPKLPLLRERLSNSILGIVSNSDNDNPLEGAEVILVGNVKPGKDKIVTFTDKDGFFKFSFVNSGSIIVSTCKNKFECFVQQEDYIGGVLTLTIKLNPEKTGTQ